MVSVIGNPLPALSAAEYRALREAIGTALHGKAWHEG